MVSYWTIEVDNDDELVLEDDDGFFLYPQYARIMLLAVGQQPYRYVQQRSLEHY